MNRVQKLLALIPDSWYSDEAKAPGGVLYSLLDSIGSGLEYIEQGIEYVKAQTRILTATDINLDNIARDFLGADFERRSGETDIAYRERIRREIFREKVTRKGVVQAVEDLGCKVVEVYEPWIDGFFTGYSMTDNNRISNANPYEAILFIQRPLNPANTSLLFTDFNFSDYNYIPSNSSNIYQITDEDIYKVINSVKAAGIRVWVVLDPISANDTDGINRVSLERYYLPPITEEAPPIAIFDESTFDDGSVMV